MLSKISSRVPLFLVLGFIPLLAAACDRAGASETVTAAPATPGTATAPIAITAADVLEQERPVVVQATGSLVADEVSDVAPETSGIVASTPVDIGDFVEQGAVIARLSTTDAELRLDQARAGLLQAEAALAQAQARHTLARANAARYDTLAETGDVSRTLQDQAATESATTAQGVATTEAAVAEARSRVALAGKALADAVIRTPLTGFITDRPVAVGEYVTTSSTIATIMKLDPVRLRLQVPELEGARLRVGQRVTATVEALGDRTFDGRITAIHPALDAATRATIVEAELRNPGAELRAGMFATGEIALSDTEHALFIPRESLVADPNTNSYRVFVLDENAVRLRVVQPGAERDEHVRILSGIDPGERVVTSGLEGLFDGASVQIR